MSATRAFDFSPPEPESRTPALCDAPRRPSRQRRRVVSRRGCPTRSPTCRWSSRRGCCCRAPPRSRTSYRWGGAGGHAAGWRATANGRRVNG
eukprot:2511487-Prymnesium_polylepis.2